MNEYVQQAVDSGRNIFLTGAGGTGKSYQTEKIIDALLISGKNVLTCAYTGVAALNIGGITLHSLLGHGLFEGSVEFFASRMIGYMYNGKNVDLVNRWIKCDTLVIDEISMMDVSLFVRASKVIRQFRKEAQMQGKIDISIDTAVPWGGIQLILVGDFLQLSPIQPFVQTLPSPGVDENGASLPGEKKVYTYLFEHPIWQEMNLEVVNLTEPKRYTNLSYFHTLCDIRIGVLSDRVRSLLEKCSTKPKATRCTSPENQHLYVEPTVLYATNREVDSLNISELNKLETQEMSYKVEFNCTSDQLSPGISLTDIIKHMGISEVSRFRIGCQVMLTRNMLHIGLCNGSRGVIVGYAQKKSLPMVEFDNGQIVTVECISRQIKRTVYADVRGRTITEKQTATATFIPLKLAYAATVHKTQGATISSVFLSASTIFAPSMLYVALSRCRDENKLYITGYTDSIFKRSMPNKKALAFYEDLAHNSA